MSRAARHGGYHAAVSALLSWLPPLVWMAIILIWLSGDAFSATRTGGTVAALLRWLLPAITATQIEHAHALLRKAGHLTIYGMLAALWLRAFVRERVLALPAAAWAAFGITVVWACVDELHQGTVASRTGTLTDVGIDAAGAAIVLVVGYVAARWNGARPPRERGAWRSL
jgi:VanZ family protein